MKRLSLILMLGLSGLSAIARQSAYAEASRKIDSLFSAYNAHTPGAAVAVVKDGKLVFMKGYGMASLEHGIPITPQTVFNIASVSKQFTAFAIYLLAEEGRISLEDDVRKYITELPAYAKPVKIKHLLAHTSGLRDQQALLCLAGERQGDIYTTEQILQLVSRQQGLNFEPGAAFGYSNTNYTLLAEIIRRVSGKSFAAFTQERIFAPLGMKHTRFCDNHEEVVQNKAASYELINGKYYHKPLNASNPGPSNLLTTVEDLVKWQLNFDRPVVGTPALLKEFNEAAYFDNGHKVVMRIFGEGDTLFHAKGQNLSLHNGLPMITHGGHTAAFRTFMGRFPEQRLAIIALSNDEHNERLNARWQIADFYIKDKMKEAAAVPASRPSQTTSRTANVQYGSPKNFEGEYYSEELRATYSFVAREDVLVMCHWKLGNIALRRIAEHTFTGSGAEVFAFELEFEQDGEKVTGFRVTNFGVKGLWFEKSLKPY